MSVSNYADKFSKQRAGRERGIGVGHRVAAREETLVVPAEKAMQKETAISKRKDNLPAANVAERANAYFGDIAWPKGGQHAFAANSQAQTAGAAQNICR